MSYTVLARRYRSQRFDDVVGQPAVAQTLRNALKTGRVAHAYLFTGTRGVGKTTMARILAKSLNCLNSEEPTAVPCCECESCTAINSGDDIDVIEIDGASNTGVDNIRQLRQNAIYRPARARFKIYIIDEVHMLSTGAFNALLKILEEPPEHVKFIFATTEPNKVLATIQSRCQRFDFSNISGGDIGEQLKKILKTEKVKYDEELVVHIARLANGSMRDGLSLLDQLISAGAKRLTVNMLEEFLGLPNREKICELLGKIGKNDAGGVLESIDSLLSTGQTCTQIGDSLIDCMRDLLVIKSTNAESGLLILTDEERKKMVALGEKFDIAAIIYDITTLERLRWTIKNSDNPRALLEASMLRLALSEHFMGVDALLAQLKSSGGRVKLPGRGAIKKKQIAPAEKTKPRRPIVEVDPPVPTKKTIQVSNTEDEEVNIGFLKNNWDRTLTFVKGKDANIGGFLKAAEPGDWRDNILTLSFPASGGFYKQMSEKNSDQIEVFLSEAVGVEVKVRFELKPEQAGEAEKKKQASANEDDALSDPAVKTLLSGLNARVVGIDKAKA
ncbi:MAG: DNA polymerase III subunit gamma/tau [Planctomycetota bacterium]|jgi:DNA polymerase-3 subunit gamma/tau